MWRTCKPHTDRTKVNPAEPLSGFGPTEPFRKVLQARSHVSVTGSDATVTKARYHGKHQLLTKINVEAVTVSNRVQFITIPELQVLS